MGECQKQLQDGFKPKTLASALNVLQQIAATYRQDFEKYARKAQVKYLEQLFRQIPHLVGKDFSYREIHGEYRKRELAPALELLERANIIHSIRHCFWSRNSYWMQMLISKLSKSFISILAFAKRS